jgi:hypothetical protein
MNNDHQAEVQSTTKPYTTSKGPESTVDEEDKTKSFSRLVDGREASIKRTIIFFVAAAYGRLAKRLGKN